MQAIPEVTGVTPEQFREAIVPAGQPVVLRGLVADWPVVAAATRSTEDFCRYIKQFDRGHDVETAYGAPSIDGRLFYNDDLSGLNYRQDKSTLSNAIDYLLEHRDDTPAPTLAIQALVTGRFLPGFDLANRLPAGLTPEGTGPRLWLGGRAIIAAHYDPSENIACCVAGARRFTLLPPEQVANLYVGPFELTPSGASISMVDFDRPDDGRFPKFRAAEEAARETVLEPGDALYIPYLWWHHVRSLDSINALVNFWWDPPGYHGTDPRNAMFHAIAAIRDLSPSQRAAWRAMFEHYVFGAASAARDHLPPGRRGMLGEPGPEDIKRLRMALARALSRN